MPRHHHTKSHRKPTKSTMPTTPVRFKISTLSHDGRGVAVYDEAHGDMAGKKAFVSFALPNETVSARITHSKKRYDEADAISVADPHPARVTPYCAHYGVCGGCAMQHVSAEYQIMHKQAVLAEHLTQMGISPMQWLPPITGMHSHYRTRARLGVRVLGDGRLIIGYRARGSHRLTDINNCAVLDRRMSDEIGTLKVAVAGLDGRAHITHIEIAMGDDTPHMPTVALIFRHTAPLSNADKGRLNELAHTKRWQIYSQPQGVSSICRIDTQEDGLSHSRRVPPTGGLYYALPKYDLNLQMSPADFSQVNSAVNRQMVAQACQLLALTGGDRVLDLFCGMGNFSLPIARLVGQTGQVIGVEGVAQMTTRAQMNAQAHGITQAHFYTHDLSDDITQATWYDSIGQIDAVLLDPPRTGAYELMVHLAKLGAQRIVYVSCDPATLARDSARLIEQGYRLVQVGIMDMFSQTTHVESVACFELCSPED